jgi:hypothetical protein
MKNNNSFINRNLIYVKNRQKEPTATKDLREKLIFYLQISSTFLKAYDLIMFYMIFIQNKF